MYRAVYLNCFLLSFLMRYLFQYSLLKEKIASAIFVPIAVLFIMPLFSNHCVSPSSTEIPHEYTSISKEIAKDKEDFRILSYHLLLQVVDLFSNGQVISTLALTLIIFLNRSVIDSYWFIECF